MQQLRQEDENQRERTIKRTQTAVQPRHGRSRVGTVQTCPEPTPRIPGVWVAQGGEDPRGGQCRPHGLPARQGGAHGRKESPEFRQTSRKTGALWRQEPRTFTLHREMRGPRQCRPQRLPRPHLQHAPLQLCLQHPLFLLQPTPLALQLLDLQPAKRARR